MIRYVANIYWQLHASSKCTISQRLEVREVRLVQRRGRSRQARNPAWRCFLQTLITDKFSDLF